MLEKLIKKIGLALDKGKIPYMIIGGQAVLLYGEPRLTRDIDITLGADLDKLQAVLKLIGDIGLKPLVDPKAFPQKTMVLPCEDDNSDIRVDFIFSFSPYEQEALKRARVEKFGEIPIKFTSPEDLIIHKIIAGRPRDLEDVKGVLVKIPDIDSNYIRYWLKEFTNALGEPFLQRFNEITDQIPGSQF